MTPLAKSQRRSQLMGRVRRQHTGPELALRRALWKAGARYRLHATLPGTPDLTFVRAKVSVFVDGCFWHGCPAHGSTPKSNVDFWRSKITRNKERDALVDAALRGLGWAVVRIWEHELRDGGAKVVSRITRLVNKRLLTGV